MAYVFSITRFLDDTPTYSAHRIPAEATGMDHPEQALILKPSKGIANDGFGQFWKHLRKILIRHPNPITAVMEMLLQSPLLPIVVVERNVDGRRGKTQHVDQFGYGR